MAARLYALQWLEPDGLPPDLAHQALLWQAQQPVQVRERVLPVRDPSPAAVFSKLSCPGSTG